MGGRGWGGGSTNDVGYATERSKKDVRVKLKTECKGLP